MIVWSLLFVWSLFVNDCLSLLFVIVACLFALLFVIAVLSLLFVIVVHHRCFVIVVCHCYLSLLFLCLHKNDRDNTDNNNKNNDKTGVPTCFHGFLEYHGTSASRQEHCPWPELILQFTNMKHTECNNFIPVITNQKAMMILVSSHLYF